MDISIIDVEASHTCMGTSGGHATSCETNCSGEIWTKIRGRTLWEYSVETAEFLAALPGLTYPDRYGVASPESDLDLVILVRQTPLLSVDMLICMLGSTEKQ